MKRYEVPEWGGRHASFAQNVFKLESIKDGVILDEILITEHPSLQKNL